MKRNNFGNLITSYAKINLYLHITGRDDKGYHILDSLFVKINLCDDILILINDDNVNIIESNYKLRLEDNLIYKAIKLFEEKYNIDNKSYFKIYHKKNIPIGAGMAGGSSNAAQMLNFMYDHYNIDEKIENKILLATNIGADVGFFINNKNGYIGGIGDIFEKEIKIVEIPIIIIKPDCDIDTSEIYSQTSSENISFKIDNKKYNFHNSSELINFLENTRNDLTDISTNICKEISEILLYAQDNNIFARMTGSGSACFLLFDNFRYRDVFFNKITQDFPKYFCFKGKII